MSSTPIKPMSKKNPVNINSENNNQEEKLEYMKMPTEMATFGINRKVYDWDESHDLSACKIFLESIFKQMENHKVENDNLVFAVVGLDANNLGYLNALLGEGEVSAVVSKKNQTINIQESIFTGIWRVTVFAENQTLVEDYIEVGDIPSVIKITNQTLPNKLIFNSDLLPENVGNAPAILTEIKDKRNKYQLDSRHTPEAINLTLLPHTKEDIGRINDILGAGNIVILSRGYGNCRISSTGVSSVWWVQYFNSTDVEILNTIEVVDIPIVACAAQEDLQVSASRLKEFIEEL